MKKYIMLVAAALIFAACVKEEVNIPTGETEFISVELNVATKTVLNGLETIWSDGDKVSVTGESYLGYLTYDSETGRFSGNITAGQKGKVTLNYPVDDQNKAVTSVPTTQVAEENTFATGAALLQGTITVEELRAGKGTILNNKAALLQFTVAQAGDVTFEVGSTKYTVTGCQTGSTYYACVDPASEVSFVARIGGYLSKKASGNNTFTANKIADLGKLPAPVESTTKLQGINGNWSSNVTMYKDVDWNVALNVKSTSTEFKFTDSNNWIGAKGSFVHKDVYAYPAGGDNIKINANTAYDIYYNNDGGLYMVLPAGTDINQDIYVATDMFIRGNYTNYNGYGNWGKGRTPVVAQGKYFCFKNYKFTSAPEFKFTTSEEGWDWQYSTETTLTINKWTDLKSAASMGTNTKYGTAGTYDIYTTSDKAGRSKVVIVKTGDPVPSL